MHCYEHAMMSSKLESSKVFLLQELNSTLWVLMSLSLLNEAITTCGRPKVMLTVGTAIIILHTMLDALYHLLES